MNIRLMNGHLQLTPKSVTAVFAALVAIGLAWGYLTPPQAAAVSSFVTAVAGILVPSRQDSPPADPATGP